MQRCLSGQELSTDKKSHVFRVGVGKKSILNLRGRGKSKATESRINKLQDIIHKIVLPCKLCFTGIFPAGPDTNVVEGNSCGTSS